MPTNGCADANLFGTVWAFAVQVGCAGGAARCPIALSGFCEPTRELLAHIQPSGSVLPDVESLNPERIFSELREENGFREAGQAQELRSTDPASGKGHGTV